MVIAVVHMAMIIANMLVLQLICVLDKDITLVIPRNNNILKQGMSILLHLSMLLKGLAQNEAPP